MRKFITSALIAASLAGVPGMASARHHYYRSTARCHRGDGTTGAVIGGVGGGLLGHAVLGGVGGTLVGAGGGALAGRSIAHHRVRCH